VLAPATFNPATEHRRFTIATNDYFTAVVAPPLARRLARVAPGVDVNIVPTAGRALEMLDAREADVVCTSWGQLPERFATATLVQDEYVCVVRKDHPFARKPPTLRQFAQAKHRLVSPRGDAHGFVDERLAEKGLTRRIVMTVNHFAAAPQIVAETDAVLTVPRLIAQRFAPPRSTVLLPCPVDAPPSTTRLSMIWHERLSLLLLFVHAHAAEDGCGHRARAHRVDADAAPDQFGRQRARKRTHRGLGGGVHAAAGHAQLVGARGGEHDRGAVAQHRLRLQHRVQHALDVDVEELVEVLVCHRRQRQELGDAGVGEQDVHAAVPDAGGVEQAGQVVTRGHVALHGGGRGAERGRCAIQCGGVAAASCCPCPDSLGLLTPTAPWDEASARTVIQSNAEFGYGISTA
jgi:DNA-binding transcriptional LysR family regulator